MGDLDIVLSELNVAQGDSADLYEKSAEDLWSNLSIDDRLKLFYCVCRRIHEGEFKHQGTYRFVLYNVFGFDIDAYTVGMECGYMDIHNAICK